MSKIKIQINFAGRIINLNGSSTLGDFKTYIDSLKKEYAVIIKENARKQVNSYLKLILKEQKIDLTPISDIEETAKINWKYEDIICKQESKMWEQKFLKEKKTREKLQKEFDDFKVEVKGYISNLQSEIKTLTTENEKLNNK